MKTASAKAKGRNLQNYVRDAILATFPNELKDGDVESRSMGAGGVDILLSHAARWYVPLSIECKATVGTPSRAELAQSRANALQGTVPCVVWKPKGAGPDKSLIMFEFSEFLALLQEVKSGQAR